MRPVQTGRVKAGRLLSRGAFARLFGAELRRMLHSPWFIGTVAVAVALVAASAVLDYLSYSEWYGYARVALDRGEFYKSYGMQSRLAPMYWVGTDGKPFSALLYFLLPMLCLLPGAGTLVEDRGSGFQSHALSRAADGAYYCAKALACFVSGALIALIPLLLAIVFASLVGPWGTPDPNEVFAFGIPITLDTPFRSLFFTQPGMYLLCWSGTAALLCGLWSIAVLAVSLYAKSPVRLFIGSVLAQLLINYMSLSVNNMFFMGSNKTLDMFTVLHPLGYVSTSPSMTAIAVLIAIYSLIGILVPIISFKRRCYL